MSRSPRPLRTGSIAATIRRRYRSESTSFPSPRPLRTGSIAAYPRSPHSRAKSCRPVLSGRAPLRQPRVPRLGLTVGVVAPSSPDGLHCGGCVGSRSFGRLGVAPSSPDGLHCGSTVFVAVNDTYSGRPVLSGRAPLRQTPAGAHGTTAKRSPRPLRTGSIAARTRRLPGPTSTPRRPVLSGRAPLRQLYDGDRLYGAAGRPVLSGRAPLRRCRLGA